MRDQPIKVILVSQSLKIYHDLENYLEQINTITSTQYVLDWLDNFKEWENEFNNIQHDDWSFSETPTTSHHQYDISLIDENILPSLKKETITNIQQKNHFNPIIIITNNDTNGQFLLNLGIADYLNIKTLNSTVLEHSLRLLTTKSVSQNSASKVNQNEPNFQEFFQKVNLGMALIAPSGQFLRANPTICQLLGYSETEFSELTFQDITHPEDLEIAWKYLEQVLTESAFLPSIAKRYLCKNQTWKWISFTASLAKDINRNPLYLIATIQNLDNNPVAQNKINSSDSLYQEFFAHSTDGLFYLSVLPNNILIYDTINTAYEKIIGISQEDIKGKKIQEVIPSLEERKYRDCINHKQSLSYEHTLNIEGIAHTWLTTLVPIEDEQGNVIKIHGSTRDITQEKNAIAQQIRQTRYRNLLRSIALKIRQSLDIEMILQTTVTELQKTIRSDRVILFQFLPNFSGKVIKESVSPHFPSMLGEIILDEYCYKNISEKYLEGYVYKWSNINYAEISLCHQELLKKYQIKANLVLPIFRNSPTILSNKYSSNSHHYLWGVLGVHQCRETREWTPEEIELLQQLIEQLNIALSQAELLESEVKQRQELARSNAELERFAYVVSHDLQAPLQTISNYVQLLERRYREKLDAKADKYINYIVGGVRRMRTQIEDLLEYSRVGREKSTFRETDCNVVLQQAISNLQSEIDSSDATVVIDNNLPTLIADFSQLVVLFQNLIGNSIKYRRQVPPHIVVQAHIKEAIWQFSVADNGIGLEAQYQKRIFQIFQRLHTQDEYPGTGIGLAICQKIVERHGGNIWVESQPGCGSVFYFTIPNQNSSHYVSSNWAILPNQIQ